MVAAAIVGSAVVGAVAASAASENASDAANRATDAQAGAARDAQAIGSQELAWNKERYAADKPLRDEAAQASIGLMRQQAITAAKQDALGDEYAAYNRNTFRPLEQRIVSEAQAYDTPERRAAAQAAAAADVESAYGSSMAGLNRQLGRAGVVPGSGRSMALQQDAALAHAGALAGATTGASRQVETLGAARLADAANLGRGLPSAQTAAVGTALQAGNSAVNSGTGAINQSAAGMGLMNGAFGGAMQGDSVAGNLYGQGATNYMRQAALYSDMAGKAMSGVGGFLGTPAGQAWLKG